MSYGRHTVVGIPLVKVSTSPTSSPLHRVILILVVGGNPALLVLLLETVNVAVVEPKSV
jgi:hypothetical protein